MYSIEIFTTLNEFISVHFIGYIYFYDKISNHNILFMVHTNGIIKYSLDDKFVLDIFRAPQKIKHHPYQISNVYCLDEKNQIIYICSYSIRKIIKFNIDQKHWDFNFWDYNSYLNASLEQLVYVDTPIAKTSFKIIQYVRNKQTNQDDRHIINYVIKNNKITQESTEMDTKYYPTKFLKLGKYLNLSNIKQLAQINPYIMMSLHQIISTSWLNSVVTYHIAWNQIIYFVTKQYNNNDNDEPKYTRRSNHGHYAVHCVDIFEPAYIHSNILRIPKQTYTDIVLIDEQKILHKIDTFIMYPQHEHNTIDLVHLLPVSIKSKHKKYNGQIVFDFCTQIIREYKFLFPEVLLKLIDSYCPSFI